MGNEMSSGTVQQSRGVALRKHYDLLYWWAIWLYAGVAWFITGAAGTVVNFGTKDIRIYSGPALGVGFVFLLLFVAVFTSIRARGAMSAILLLVLLLIGVVMYLTGFMGYAIARFPDLRVHMNQAFYGVIFTVLFPTWLLTTFVFNRMNYFILHDKKVIAHPFWAQGCGVGTRMGGIALR